MEWKINNDYPYLNNLIELSSIFSQPYLDGIFKSQNDYPYLSFIPTFDSIFTKPYPKNIFQINNGYPYFSSVDKTEPILTKKYPENVFIQKDNSYPILYGCAKFERGSNIEILTNKSPTYQDKYMLL